MGFDSPGRIASAAGISTSARLPTSSRRTASRSSFAAPVRPPVIALSCARVRIAPESTAGQRHRGIPATLPTDRRPVPVIHDAASPVASSPRACGNAPATHVTSNVRGPLTLASTPAIVCGAITTPAGRRGSATARR